MIHIAKPQIGPEKEPTVLEVLDSGMIVHGVGCATYCPVPIHRQAYYVSELRHHVSMPVAEQAALEAVSLPILPSERGEDLRTVAEAANSFPRVA